MYVADIVNCLKQSRCDYQDKHHQHQDQIFDILVLDRDQGHSTRQTGSQRRLGGNARSFLSVIL